MSSEETVTITEEKVELAPYHNEISLYSTVIEEERKRVKVFGKP